MSDTRYVFDNAHGETRERFPALSDLYDDETIRCLQAVGVAPGWQCLEVAAGGGSIARWLAVQVGPSGRVVGVDLNPAMCAKVQAHAATTEMPMECREGSMEDIPLPDASVDAVLSNGVINLSFRKRRVIQEIFRVLRPGGRISITDIVSAKQLSQSIVNEPKLWAS